MQPGSCVDGDLTEANVAIERLAAAPADDGLVMRDVWLLRLRALLARARGDDGAYRDYRGATATWRDLLASKDISRGPRPCHDGGHASACPPMEFGKTHNTATIIERLS